MVNKYKLIATDFDGTLLDDNKKVSSENIKILKQCRENNYIIVGITGRTLGSVKKDINVELFDYLILNNGSCLYEVSTRELTYLNKIDRNTAIQITSLTEDLVDKIDYCSAINYYTYKSRTTSSLDFIINIESIKEVKESIAKINIFIKPDNDLDTICQKITQKYNVNSFIMQDSNNETKLLTINPKNINKKETLKKLGIKLGIIREEMIFFGDGLNDVEIIEWVGCGVAMENALYEVKKRATYITLSNNNSGISKFLQPIIKGESEKKFIKK